MYSEYRLSTLDHPPQTSVVDHQLMNQPNDTVQNEVYLQPNNTSTPFQPQNHKPMLLQQQNQVGPSDTVVQHLQQEALNQSELNNMLGFILSSQQNLQ